MPYFPYERYKKQKPLQSIWVMDCTFIFPLSLRRTSESCLFCQTKPCTHLELDKKCSQKKITSKKKKMDEFIIDETAIKKVGSGAIWLWIATIKPNNKEIVAISISKRAKHFCGRAVCIEFNQNSLRAFCTNR